MKKLLLLTLVVAMAAAGCSGKRTKKIAEEAALDEARIHEMMRAANEHNARTSLDWAGTYVGTVPTASNPGLRVTLTLRADETYLFHGHYVDRSEEADLRDEGAFAWDDAGTNITLGGIHDGMNRFRVEEGRLRMLDKDGNVITGDLAEFYILLLQAEE